MTEKVSLKIVDLDCPDCAAKLEKNIARIEGVQNCALDFTSKTARISIDKDRIGPDELRDKIGSLGHKAVSQDKIREYDRAKPGRRRDIKKILLFVSIVFALALLATSFLDIRREFKIVFSVMAVLSGGVYVFRAAFYSLKNLTADMNLLMSIAVIGALIIGEWTEAAVTIVLFALANYLEGRSVRKAHTAFQSLSEKIPHEIEKEENGLVSLVPLENIHPGDIIRLKPGMTCPTDCEIVEGRAYIDQSTVTGESQPVSKGPGDELLSGVINTDGSLRLKVNRHYEDSTLSKIITLVEESSAHKARLANIVDRFASVYTPIVVGLAVLAAVIPPLFFAADFTTWFYRALVFLVIACPCALVISTPVAVICALTRGARDGILIKGGIFLEKLAKVRTVLLDKTGTLTEGRFEVSDIITMPGYSEDDILSIAASIEQHSEHPIARAIVAGAAKREIMLRPTSDFRAYPGEGARARVEGRDFTVGSHRFFHRGKDCDETMHKKVSEIEERGLSLVLLSEDQKPIGAIALNDIPKAEAADALESLRRAGIGDLVMLTGDNRQTAESIAEKVGITNVESELLPDQKSRLVGKYRHKKESVLMVGDGINDAPALAEADVGVAMGTGGSDIAIEAADVAIIGDNLSMVPRAVRLSKRALNIIKFNIVFSLAIKFIFVILAGLGLATLWMAVFADMGTSLLVIANSLRLLRH